MASPQEVILNLSAWASSIYITVDRMDRDYKITLTTGKNHVEGKISEKTFIVARYHHENEALYEAVDKLDDQLFDMIFENAEAGDLLG